MPKPRFNKDAFLQANKATQEAGSNFGVIQNGLYNAEIQQATLKTTTNGAYQA
nr:hypothetical protein [Candidatus Dadabacteria bacterium]